jgi:peptidyl-prolyl cis-trans isomerase C
MPKKEPLSMKNLFKEPLLHFLALGAAIFAVSAWKENTRLSESEPSSTHIDVSATVIERLRAGFERQFGQPPDVADLQGLVTAHIREEVLCREALALGLDRDDTIVRRRLAQKMEFLTDDLAGIAGQDEASIQQYFSENAERYMKPGRVTFRHVYFSKEKRRAGATAAASEALAALEKGSSDETLGDPFLHGYAFSESEADDVAATFGPDFAKQLHTQTAGEWRGPLASSYGLHLVLVEKRSETRPVKLDEVRATVMRDLNEERRLATNRDVFEKLRERYEVTVDEAALAKAAASAGKTAQR